jgi:hypothetical protein
MTVVLVSVSSEEQSCFVSLGKPGEGGTIMVTSVKELEDRQLSVS